MNGTVKKCFKDILLKSDLKELRKIQVFICIIPEEPTPIFCGDKHDTRSL